MNSPLPGVRHRSFKHDLTPARRALLELLQNIGHGTIFGLQVRDGEPVLLPAPVVEREFVLHRDEQRHDRGDGFDFQLKELLVVLFRHMDAGRTFVIDRLTIQNGLPTRFARRDHL